MKFINKLFLIALIVAIGACDATDLDLQDSPNAVTPENASVNDLYNSIQLTFNYGVFNSAQFGPGAVSRMYHAGSFNYESQIGPNSMNGLWNSAYAGLFPDIDALIPLADAAGLDIHAGSAKVMKAYTMMTIVDILGDVPFSQAGQGTDVISPTADSGSDIYNAAIALLDEAIAQMSGTAAAGPSSDVYYGGDGTKWVTLAKTLKLRAAVNTRLVGGGPNIGALISEGDLIDEASEDFQFNYGGQRANPDSRHPRYADHYEVADGTYQSNYFMWLVRAEKRDANDNVIPDPRVRYYFYRQTDMSAGHEDEAYSCGGPVEIPDQEGTPDHYGDVDENLPYCFGWSDGYYGRDHLNGTGTPPDGQYRTAPGVYPAGGDFDDSSFESTRQQGTTGGSGAGISPIVMSSFVDFMRAEAALTMGTGEDARALLESGMRKSIAKTISFGSLVSAKLGTVVTLRDGSMGTINDLFGASEDDIERYVSLVLDNYDNTSDKLDVVMKEYFIAMWGNGIEAYNMYRRTGKPNNMAPGIEPDPGTFPNSFLYPANYVNRNSSATQKADLTSRVFWDDGSANTY